MRLKIKLFIAILLCAGNIFANGITVSTPALTGQNTGSKFTLVQFNLSWSNSWKSSTLMYDAAWLFVKFRLGNADISLTGASSSGTTITVASTTGLRAGMPLTLTSGTGVLTAGTVVSSITDATHFVVNTAPSTPLSSASVTAARIWEHAVINTTGHSGGTGTASTITPSSDGSGAFIYRSGNGTGAYSVTGMQLRWDYGTNNVADDAIVQVKVFAVEMVYVPTGTFAVGTTGAETQRYTLTTINTGLSTTQPAGTGSLGGQAGGCPTPGGSTMTPATDSWPNGYNAFYCMKYEIAQQQYVDFLNTLTRTQQSSRVGTTISSGTTSVTNRYVMSNTSTLSYRNGIRCDASINATDPVTFYCDLSGNGTGGETTDGQWIACNYLSWMDMCAYLDWSGLRPMTEMEFEKSCRGTIAPVANEYIWGSTTITQVTGITNSGMETETASNTGNGLCVYGNHASVQGPLRVGALATSSTTTRISAGATYYGILDMSGNLMERAVTNNNAAGQSFTGVHGNGSLNKSGDADCDYWPGINGNTNNTTANTAYGGTTGVTEATGSGGRGDTWNSASTYLCISSRNYYMSVFSPVRNTFLGGRGVRSAP